MPTSRTEPTIDFGIYIKTFRPDHYLAKVLIASIRHYLPDVDITIVPDDGYRRATLWGEKVLTLDGPFFSSLRGFYKKLWVFFGHYERFIYLDADMLALRPLQPLMDRVVAAKEPFFIANGGKSTLECFSNGTIDARRAKLAEGVGDPDLLKAFDPDYALDPLIPFNSGLFATHRGIFPLDEVRNTFCAAQQFHRVRGLPPLATSRQGVFMGDQGFINYLAYRNGRRPELLPDVFLWGGKSMREYRKIQNRGPAGPCQHLFVHWAGCPRPTLLHRRVPAGDAWIKHYFEYYRKYGSLATLFRDSATNVTSDLWRGARRLGSRWRTRPRQRNRSTDVGLSGCEARS